MNMKPDEIPNGIGAYGNGAQASYIEVANAFLCEVRGVRSKAEQAVTLCMVRFLGLARKRVDAPAIGERVEGIMRNSLRATDRMCWSGPESFVIVAGCDIRGAYELMARVRELKVELSKAAGGSIEIVWGLACSLEDGDRTLPDLLKEAQINLHHMIASQ